MSKLIPFEFESHNVRITMDDNDNPWWIAKDVCEILGIKDVSNAVMRLEPDEKRDSLDTREMRRSLIINEKGLYRLIFRSNKPEAKRFQDWVFGEVLPQIRKTGRYEAKQEVTEHDMFDVVRSGMSLLDDLGYLTEDTKFLLAERVKNIVLDPAKLLESSKLKGVAELIDEVYPALSAKTLRSIRPKIGSLVKKEYVRRYGHDPLNTPKFVNGAVRPVAQYEEHDWDWIIAIVQTTLTHEEK